MTESPRLLCPHRNLVRGIRRLLKCGKTHEKPGTFCKLCRSCQFCQHCRTKVHDLRKLEDIDTYKNYGWILRVGGRSEESSATTIGSLGLFSSSRRNMINMEMVAYSFRVEKCLDDNIWPLHTVFPYARRQIPLDGSSPSPYRNWPCPDGKYWHVFLKYGVPIPIFCASNEQQLNSDEEQWRASRSISVPIPARRVNIGRKSCGRADTRHAKV